MKIFLVVVPHFCKIDFAAGMPFNPPLHPAPSTCGLVNMNAKNYIKKSAVEIIECKLVS